MAKPATSNDTHSFQVGGLGGRPIGCIAAVSYGRRFGFIGLYIVLPEYRAMGCGIALWRASMARLAGRNVGRDGILAQPDSAALRLAEKFGM